MTAVATRKRKTANPVQRRSAVVREQAYNGAPLRIDRDKGIIYGVKVLGRFSPNTHGQAGAERTEYSQRALQECADFINNGDGSVKINHPKRGNVEQERDVYETLGVLRNGTVTDDGTRADFHYYATHELTPRVLEDVEKALGQFGLSINGRGDGTVKNRVYVVESLTELRSVDLVDRPATNRNLWESRESKPMKTARTLIESLSKKLSEARQQWAARLLEDDAMAPALDAPAEDAPTDPDEALANGFQAAILACVSDDSMDAKAKAKKIADLLKTHEKLAQKPEPEAPAQEEDDGEDEEKGPPAQEGDEDAKDDKKMESIRRELDELKARDTCRDLCESLGFTPTKDQLAALIEIRTPAIRKATAQAFKGSQAASDKGNSGPRSRAFGRPVTESRERAPTTDHKAFAAALLN